MAADVNSNLASWSTSEASNSPSGSTAISTNLDDNLRTIQAVVRKYLATKGSDLASATTTDLSTTDGNFIDITGTTTITGFGTLSAGMWKVLQFDGALTLTHNATSLILPTGANITTTAGDCCFAYSLGSGNWIVPFYQSSKGIPFIDTNAFAVGSSDATKKARVELDGLTASNTRVGTWLDYDFRFMSQTKGSDVASAGTLNLDTATGDLVDVTGTTSITAITLAEGKSATVRFTGSLTLTHGASLVLPGGKNITTVAGDIATFRGYAAGVVRCSAYQMFPGIVHETAVASTSGTAIAFSNIPSGVRRITVMLSGVSTNGTSDYLLQLGTGGAATTSGYLGSGAFTLNANNSTVTNYTAGFGLPVSTAAAVLHGVVTFTAIDPSTNVWVCSGSGGRSDTTVGYTIGGSVTLAGALDYLRITTSGGVNTFDAGTINIMYER